MDKDKVLHDGLPPELSIETIAEGHLDALVKHALAKIAENIADPNTSSKAKRKITISLEFLPYKDRTGATVSTSLKSTLAGVEAVESPMYIAEKQGRFLSFARNHKQQDLQFEMSTASATETAAKKPQ